MFAVAPFMLYLLDHREFPRADATRRAAALTVMAIFVVTVSGWSGEAGAEAPAFLAVTLLTVWLTYVGIGAIAGWAFRFAWAQFGALVAFLPDGLGLPRPTSESGSVRIRWLRAGQLRFGRVGPGQPHFGMPPTHMEHTDDDDHSLRDHRRPHR